MIPNFVGADLAAWRLAQTPAWAAARTVQTNPDHAQTPIRIRALYDGKVVYTPVPYLTLDFPYLRLDPARLRSVLLSLLEDHGHQRAVAEAARGVCSGEGALLVVDHMVGRAGLRLRPTRAEDAALLFHWANEPSTRRASVGRRSSWLY
jgi:hypothetical protein